MIGSILPVKDEPPDSDYWNSDWTDVWTGDCPDDNVETDAMKAEWAGTGQDLPLKIQDVRSLHTPHHLASVSGLGSLHVENEGDHDLTSVNPEVSEQYRFTGYDTEGQPVLLKLEPSLDSGSSDVSDDSSIDSGEKTENVEVKEEPDSENDSCGVCELY